MFYLNCNGWLPSYEVFYTNFLTQFILEFNYEKPHNLYISLSCTHTHRFSWGIIYEPLHNSLIYTKLKNLMNKAIHVSITVLPTLPENTPFISNPCDARWGWCWHMANNAAQLSVPWAESTLKMKTTKNVSVVKLLLPTTSFGRIHGHNLV
jgi:hypothetical protein